jgi:hypothetical protein
VQFEWFVKRQVGGGIFTTSPVTDGIMVSVFVISKPKYLSGVNIFLIVHLKTLR